MKPSKLKYRTTTFSSHSICTQNSELHWQQQFLLCKIENHSSAMCVMNWNRSLRKAFSEKILLSNSWKYTQMRRTFYVRDTFEFHRTKKISLGPQMPIHTDDVFLVPSECNMICSARSGNCVLDGKVDDGDVHMNADKLLDFSTSCSGNEESSTDIKDRPTDSLKLYGCGICCQSFSTKEKTIHIHWSI